ncbi:MAG: hypothetical protein Fur0040_09550 [Sideroxydans sp.]
MNYLIWAARAVVFLLLLGFAVKNEQPVILHLFFGLQWHTSLMVVLLCFFAAGAVLGMVAMLPVLLRQRRALAQVRPVADQTSAASSSTSLS